MKTYENAPSPKSHDSRNANLGILSNVSIDGMNNLPPDFFSDKNNFIQYDTQDCDGIGANTPRCEPLRLFQSYDYFIDYFKQPKHVKYVIGSFLFLDDGNEISLKGQNHHNSSPEEIRTINKSFKEKYLDKTLTFILLSKEIFIEQYLPGLRDSKYWTEEENSLVQTINQPDVQNNAAGTVPEVSIEGINDPFLP